MRRPILIAAAFAAGTAHAQTPPGEAPVDPYVVADANAGATPIDSRSLIAAFNGRDGVFRIANATIDRSAADPRIADIFRSHDLVRVKRTLGEQLCYLLGGGCAYSGRDMTTTHKDLGLQLADFNALVEHLQDAMDAEGVPFAAQNRLLARLAPMQRMIVTR